jgi:hypothetical protein
MPGVPMSTSKPANGELYMSHRLLATLPHLFLAVRIVPCSHLDVHFPGLLGVQLKLRDVAQAEPQRLLNPCRLTRTLMPTSQLREAQLPTLIIGGDIPQKRRKTQI